MATKTHVPPTLTITVIASRMKQTPTNVAVVGKRGTGKTTFVFQLLNRIHHNRTILVTGTPELYSPSDKISAVWDINDRDIWKKLLMLVDRCRRLKDLSREMERMVKIDTDVLVVIDDYDMRYLERHKWTEYLSTARHSYISTIVVTQTKLSMHPMDRAQFDFTALTRKRHSFTWEIFDADIDTVIELEKERESSVEAKTFSDSDSDSDSEHA